MLFIKVLELDILCIFHKLKQVRFDSLQVWTGWQTVRGVSCCESDICAGDSLWMWAQGDSRQGAEEVKKTEAF